MLKHQEHLNVLVILSVVVNMLKLQVLLNVLVMQFVVVILSVDVIKYAVVKEDSVLVKTKI